MKTQNKTDFNLYSMAGLWFEYVYEDHMGTDMDHYVCSSFIWLDEGNGDYIVYNSFQFPVEEELWSLEKKQRERQGLPIFTEEEIEQAKKDKEDPDKETHTFRP